jgi:hypothetical protein
LNEPSEGPCSVTAARVSLRDFIDPLGRAGGGPLSAFDLRSERLDRLQVRWIPQQQRPDRPRSGRSRRQCWRLPLPTCCPSPRHHQAYSHYVEAINLFCRSLVSASRLVANQLAGMGKLNPEEDVRHPRRVSTWGEFATLGRLARASGRDIRATMGYVHLGLAGQAAAKRRLPWQ